MAKQVVACLDVWAPNVRQVVRDNAPPELELRFAGSHEEAEQLGLVRDCDLILVGGAALTGSMVKAALPRLKFIQKWGIGVDRIDVEAVRRLGVPLAITGGANAVPVAELAIALMLAVYRRIPYADRKTRAGEWIKPQMRGMCYMIDGKTVGLLGFGAIAKMVARRLAGFDCNVVYHDVNRADHITERALNARWVPFDELITKSDILSIHVPLTKQTANIIDAAQVARMKEGAILVNTARGGIVDEAALLAALVSGKLRGAGIDTFAEEPPPKDHPLLQLENVVLTPHAGGGVFDNVENVARHAIGNMLKFLAGAPLPPQDIVVPVRTSG
ncbi:MAG TPA: 2-hydroxyacid dehydrogenase [Falsiroseomonas sp.]|jgi:D-3-phosphoglycerate dehydrogenase|nr:2-hydroxyacid dehydrogenase [Falsiroseomonas sp.]